MTYRIEVLEIGCSGGKMDQYTIANGKTIFLDTKTDFGKEYLISLFL